MSEWERKDDEGGTEGEREDNVQVKSEEVRPEITVVFIMAVAAELDVGYIG